MKATVAMTMFATAEAVAGALQSECLSHQPHCVFSQSVQCLKDRNGEDEGMLVFVFVLVLVIVLLLV